jgi:hypothetical protein
LNTVVPFMLASTPSQKHESHFDPQGYPYSIPSDRITL